MNPAFKEKLCMIGVSATLAVVASFLQGDPDVRQLLLMLAAGPPFAVLYPRAEERELRRQLRSSKAP